MSFHKLSSTNEINARIEKVSEWYLAAGIQLELEARDYDLVYFDEFQVNDA